MKIYYDKDADLSLIKRKHVAIIGYGTMLLTNAWKAADELAQQGISAAVIDLPWLNRIDDAWVKTLGAYKHIVTLDNHYLVIQPRSSGVNRRAIGAVVRITIGGLNLTRLITRTFLEGQHRGVPLAEHGLEVEDVGRFGRLLASGRARATEAVADDPLGLADGEVVALDSGGQTPLLGTPDAPDRGDALRTGQSVEEASEFDGLQGPFAQPRQELQIGRAHV